MPTELDPRLQGWFDFLGGITGAKVNTTPDTSHMSEVERRRAEQEGLRRAREMGLVRESDTSLLTRETRNTRLRNRIDRMQDMAAQFRGQASNFQDGRGVVNPYNRTAVAPQQAQQLLALRAMQAQAAPDNSLTAMQNARAMAQARQAGAAPGVVSPLAQAIAARQATAAAGGIAGDAGDARAAELAKLYASQQGLATGMTRQDLQERGQFNQMQLAAQRRAQAMNMFYTQLAEQARRGNVAARQQLQNLRAAARLKDANFNDQLFKDVIGTGATMVSTMGGMG